MGILLMVKGSFGFSNGVADAVVPGVPGVFGW